MEIETVDEFRFELAVTSFTFASTCLRFCSNPLGVFTQVFEMHLETSFACCNAVYYASRVEKITLFKSRISDTVLSAIILTNVVYALTAASGVKKIVTNPLNAHYTVHVDWSASISCFWNSYNLLKCLLQLVVIVLDNYLLCY